MGGFDLIYACSDVEFDRRQKLQSFPARFGVGPALAASAMLHLCAAVLLFLFVFRAGLGRPSAVMAGVVTALLVYEHWLVRPDDLSKVGASFFTINGTVSLLLMSAVLWDVGMRGAP